MQSAKVSFFQTNIKNHSVISDYAICSAKACAPIKSKGMHLYNPLTVLMLKEVIIKGNHKNVIHSSNDEVINRLLQRLCRYFKVNFSNFNNENAKKIIADIQPTLMIIGSCDINYSVFNLLPNNSELFLYTKTTEINGINPSDLIFQGKKIRGFYVINWFLGLGMGERYENMHFIEDNPEIFRNKTKKIRLGEIEDCNLYQERKKINIQQAINDAIERKKEEDRSILNMIEDINQENDNFIQENEKPIMAQFEIALKDNIDYIEREENSNIDGDAIKEIVSIDTSEIEELKISYSEERESNIKEEEEEEQKKDKTLVISEKECSSSDEIFKVESDESLEKGAITLNKLYEAESVLAYMKEYENPIVTDIFNKLPEIQEEEYKIEENFQLLGPYYKILEDNSLYIGMFNQYNQPHGLGKRYYSDGSIFNGF